MADAQHASEAEPLGEKAPLPHDAEREVPSRSERLLSLGILPGLNWVLMAFALTLSSYQAFRYRAEPDATVLSTRPTLHAQITPEVNAAGERGLRDSTGHFVPLKDYKRIASASTISDEVLLDLCEPERVIAHTHLSLTQSPSRHRFVGKPAIPTTEDVEGLVALKPDLVLLNTLGNEARKERLRSAGLEVFDLGAMRGASTMVPNVLALGWLIGQPARAEQWVFEFQRRLTRVAADVPKAARRQGMYVGVHGTKLYGGSRGTSYEDILGAAGLIDVAATRYQDWPAYTPEQLLELDPEIVITQDRMSATICTHTELGRLKACRGEGQIVEVDPAVLGSPGTYIALAAERIRDAVYGPPPWAPKEDERP